MKAFFFIPLCFLGGSLACSEDDPAETRDGFCNRWATAACSASVVSACQAADADACRLSQERVCLGLVPSDGFVADYADSCIQAVEGAYADADLSAAELNTVVRLGPPCERLVRGPRGEAESCTSDLDCDGPGGFGCVFKGSEITGSCQEPVVVEPGRDCGADGAVCTEGFYCDEDDCVEGGATGEACGRTEECSLGFCGPNDVCSAGFDIDTPCASDEQCASGLCYEFSDTERVCTDRVRLSRTDPICETLR